MDAHGFPAARYYTLTTALVFAWTLFGFKTHSRSFMMNQTPKYLFCINTGRSGSDYLCKLFEHVEGMVSRHEPLPIGNGRPMRLYAKGNQSPMRKITEQKMKAIKEMTAGHNHYFESNHCFIKGFGWMIPEYISENQIGVIILKREKSKIVQSLSRIKCSPFNHFGRKWITTPDARTPLIKPPISSKHYKLLLSVGLLFYALNSISKRMLFFTIHKPKWLIEYENRCLSWYVDETDEKSRHYQKRHPGIRYYDTDIDSMNKIECVMEMMTYFGYEPKSSIGSVVGNPTNLKLQKS